MRWFTIIHPHEVVDYRRFYWYLRRDDGIRFFARLMGVKLDGGQIHPVYQPVFTVEKESGRYFFEIHFTRWTSYMIVLSRSGLHGTYLDMRKDYGADERQPF